MYKFLLALCFCKFYFSFELAYINNRGGFIVMIPYVGRAYFEHIHLLHCGPIPPCKLEHCGFDSILSYFLLLLSSLCSMNFFLLDYKYA
jgi:hypothetical protein